MLYGKAFVYILVLAAFCLAGPVRSEANIQLALPADYPPGLDDEGIWNHANELYRQGKFNEALEGYCYLYALGIQNGYLFFNLGNAYFNVGRLGPSILWYERARLYLPRYKDLQVNYTYARSVLADEEFRGPEYGGTLGFFISIHNWLNLREWLFLLLVTFWMLMLLFTARIVLKDSSRRSWFSIPCWILSIAFILIFLSTAFKVYEYDFIQEAIVMAPAVEIKTGPGQEFTTLFSLHEGTKVRLIQNQDDWVRVILPGNTAFNGWMPESSVESISLSS